MKSRTAADHPKSKFDQGPLLENLALLYLRLNGFFTTRHIIHSPENGKVTTEIDFLAVRFVHHSEPELEHGPDPYLQISEKYIELAICEVKSRKGDLHFNPRLRNPGSVKSLLLRTGLFPPQAVGAIVEEVTALLLTKEVHSGVMEYFDAPGNIRIRPLLFSPEYKQARHNQPWFVYETPIMEYLTQCLTIHAKRESCSPRYGPDQWKELGKLVKYFKQEKPDPSVKSLIEYFKKGD